MCVVWGVPYLLIKVAVDDGLSPFVVVSGRCLVGAALLLPFAVRGAGFRALTGHWRTLLAYTVIELGGPWLLLTHAETRTSNLPFLRHEPVNVVTDAQSEPVCRTATSVPLNVTRTTGSEGPVTWNRRPTGNRPHE